MEKGGLMEVEARRWKEFVNIDYGIEWCENQILKAASIDLATEVHTLAEHLEEKNTQTAATFHRFMVQFLAERLINTDKTLKTLLD